MEQGRKHLFVPLSGWLYPCLSLSVGIREADINVAQGQKQARILTSEAYKAEKINQAVGRQC